MSGRSKSEAAPTPKTSLVWPLPDGRQLVLVDDLTLSIPKDTNKCYHARVIFRGGESGSQAILYNPKRQLLIDGSAYVERVYMLLSGKSVPAITADAVQSVEVLSELSHAEYESITQSVKSEYDFMVRGKR